MKRAMISLIAFVKDVVDTKQLIVVLSFILLAFMPLLAYADKPTSDVNVVNTPTVQVGNNGTNPVPVQVTNTPSVNVSSSINAFQFARDVEIPGGHSHGEITLPFNAIPNGKRFVIQSVTVLTVVEHSQGNQPEFVSFSTRIAGGNDQTHYIPMQAQHTDLLEDSYAGAISGAWYTDSGTRISFSVSFPNSLPTNALVDTSFDLSGYLVDIPH